MQATVVFPTQDIKKVLPPNFAETVRLKREQGFRTLTFYARPSSENQTRLTLTLILINQDGKVEALRCDAARDQPFSSLTPEFPDFHIFEREISEQYALAISGHPWLKPLRYPLESSQAMEDYPYFILEGKEVHQVGVGPVHAGVIEPGHFRFMCLGEQIHHLEIQLGYQHRGVEKLLLKKDPYKLSALVESMVGDSAIAHVSAYAQAIEGLAAVELNVGIHQHRALALELERIAMHLVGLSGICADIAYLPGASHYGRLRTLIINTTMKICGNRFGRSWIRPMGLPYVLSKKLVDDLTQTLQLFQDEIEQVHKDVFSSRAVKKRLQGMGALSREQAQDLGIVGMIARASGVDIDLRTLRGGLAFDRFPIPTHTLKQGDCWDRLHIRKLEISSSVSWILKLLQLIEIPQAKDLQQSLKPLQADTLAISMIEAWRGEVIHCLETNSEGQLLAYKVQDPSLRNWHGMAIAARGQAIYDFPICNKSFDLSYCGHDL